MARRAAVLLFCCSAAHSLSTFSALQQVLLQDVAGTVYAVSNKCSHLNLSLQGKTALLSATVTPDCCVVCPAHGTAFDLATGAVKGVRCAALRCAALRCAALRCAALHCAAKRMQVALHCAAKRMQVAQHVLTSLLCARRSGVLASRTCRSSVR
jgi:nitrite reductase/ring-hydroxylating ferredoxin subunit